MQPSKLPAPVAFLFVFLAFAFTQFNPQNIQTEKSVSLPEAKPTATQPVLPVETGRREILEAIVPLERLNRPAYPSSAPAEHLEPDLLVAAEGLKFSPSVLQFIDDISDGQAGEVRGVHIPDVLTLPVVQQPEKNPAYVSEENDTVTQFQSAAQYGVTGLLAHNYLAGEMFYNIEIGQEVVIVMGDGATQQYRVSGIFQFRKISPNNLRSKLIDLNDGKNLTTAQVFSRFYRGDPKVTFQTCLEGEGILNWGLTFIVADPVEY